MDDYVNTYKGKCLTCTCYLLTTNMSEMHSTKGFWCRHFQCYCLPDDKCKGSYSQDIARGNNIISDALGTWKRKQRL